MSCEESRLIKILGKAALKTKKKKKILNNQSFLRRSVKKREINLLHEPTTRFSSRVVLIEIDVNKLVPVPKEKIITTVTTQTLELYVFS